MSTKIYIYRSLLAIVLSALSLFSLEGYYNVDSFIEKRSNIFVLVVYILTQLFPSVLDDGRSQRDSNCVCYFYQVFQDTLISIQRLFAALNRETCQPLIQSSQFLETCVNYYLKYTFCKLLFASHSGNRRKKIIWLKTVNNKVAFVISVDDLYN